MNRRTVGLLAMSLALAPISVLAQTDSAPPAPPAPMAHPDRDFSQMRQMHQQFERIHNQERDAVLGALTPQHRELVANIVGQLSIASRPDPRAAASRLDASLTSSEKNAILSAHQTAMTQMHSAMQQMHSQMAPQGGGPPPQTMQQHGSSRHQPTAGDIVLRVAGAAPHDMMFVHQEHH